VETLISFLKFSSVLDWLVMLMTLVLITVSLVLLLVLRGRKPFYFVVALAVLPLFGGLLSTFLKYQQMGRALEMTERVPSEVIESATAEAWMITYVAAAGALVIVLIGVIGIVMKKPAAAS
jgi:hypothetical protein